MDKKIDAKNIDSIMNKLVTNGAKMYPNGEKGENGNKAEKPKKQRKRVGVNPVLGNAGTMWEPSKKAPHLVGLLVFLLQLFKIKNSART